MDSTKFIYFANLDALRFIAFFMVLAQHAGLKGVLSVLPQDFFGRIVSLVCSGDKGVSFFFVLSGFLITYLLIREHNKNSRIDVLSFYVRRMLRIWPLYYLVLFLGFVVLPAGLRFAGYSAEFSDDPWYYVFFLGNFDIINLSHEDLLSKSFQVVGITWSVAIEEQFYLFWPLIFLMKRNFLKYAFIVIVLISWIFRAVNQGDYSVIYYHTLSVFSDFAVGGFLAYCSIEFPVMRSFLSRMKKRYIALVYGLSLIYLLYGPGLFGYLKGLDRLLTSLVFAFVIFEQCFIINPIVNFGKMKVVSFLGKISYGLYLYHFVGMLVVSGFFKWIGISSKASAFNGLLYFVISLATTALIASISYHYYESFFLRIKDKMFSVNDRQSQLRLDA